jgi:hypothetical protein
MLATVGMLQTSVAAGESGPVLMLAGEAERGGALVIARPQYAVARLLQLMGVDELLVVQGGAAGQAKLKDFGTRESGEERQPPGEPY